MDKINRIRVGDAFLVAVGRYLQDKKSGADYINSLTKKKYTIKDTDSTYRVINHWSSLGLFDDVREDKKGWRKFSLVDMMWLRVLIELRKFGLSLNKIKTGYTSLKKEMQILECGIVLCILRKGINLVVFSDGCIEIVPRDAIATSESMGFFNDMSYLVISLNNCLNRMFPHKDFSPELDIFSLTKKEMSVLSEIRLSECDEIAVRMKDGEVDRIDTKFKQTEKIGKLSDILNPVTNGDFLIKKKDGKISFIEKTIKEKV